MTMQEPLACAVCGIAIAHEDGALCRDAVACFERITSWPRPSSTSAPTPPTITWPTFRASNTELDGPTIVVNPTNVTGVTGDGDGDSLSRIHVVGGGSYYVAETVAVVAERLARSTTSSAYEERIAKKEEGKCNR